MTDTSLFGSSLRHVQTTARELRNGYPYFRHHNSISALWSQKWRPSCASSIYPFTDAKVEDFDPVFDELVRTWDDDPSLLCKPDDYAKPFFPVAADLVSRATRAIEQGRAEEARDFFLRAAAVYRIARFPINRSPLSELAWEKGKEAYEKGGQLLDPPSLPLDIAFTAAEVLAGDQNVPIKTYLRLPRGDRPERGWPVVLFICGLDAYRTDHTPRTQAHVDQGFATLSFEIPGTGDSPAAPNDPRSPDRLMSSALDWIAANASRLGLDETKVVARGISTGGYYAFRVAHTHADRLFAVIAQGGGCHHMFDPDWIDVQNQMEYPFALAEALAYKFGYRDANPEVAIQNYAADAHKFSLVESGLIEMPACKMLIINGMEDSIFPIEDSFIVANTCTGMDLIARGNRGHMGNPGAEDLVYSWINRAIAGEP